MGKRSPIRRTIDGRTRRKRIFTPKQFREIIEDLRQMATEIESLNAEVESRGFAEIGVDGAGKIDDALVLMRQFIGKIKGGIDNAIAESRAK